MGGKRLKVDHVVNENVIWSSRLLFCKSTSLMIFFSQFVSENNCCFTCPVHHTVATSCVIHTTLMALMKGVCGSSWLCFSLLKWYTAQPQPHFIRFPWLYYILCIDICTNYLPEQAKNLLSNLESIAAANILLYYWFFVFVLTPINLYRICTKSICPNPRPYPLAATGGAMIEYARLSVDLHIETSAR